MATFDLTPFYRSTVGFDRLFDMLTTSNGSDALSGFPPYNIERLDEDKYQITMAVAGFGDDDLAVEVKEDVLTVRGENKNEKNGNSFLHRGIAARSFERSFHLADHVEVEGAQLENGLLHIALKRIVPEEKKPRRINIGAKAKNGSQLLQGHLA